MVYRTSESTQIRKDEKKEYIINEAAKLFEKHGYVRTTVKDVVEAADISTGSFYFYFKNKEALFEALYDRFITTLENVSEYSFCQSENVVSGFSKSKTAELWLFQHYRGLARAMIVEAVGLNPEFEVKREEIYRQSHERIVKRFIKMNSSGYIKNIDPWIATLLCNGTLYSVINDWLQGDGKTNLVEYAYPIILFNLNAFKIPYDESEVQGYINDMIIKMEEHYRDLINFKID
jgi:Transcriptional regulator